MELTNTPSFEDWVKHCFDHPVSEPAWHYTDEAVNWEAPREVTLAFMTRLFTASEESLGRFSDGQLNQGFWYLVSGFSSDHMYLLVDEDLPEADRLACVRSLSLLFAGIFSSRCTNAPSHKRNDNALSPLNSVCYMWFDVMPVHPTFGMARKNLDATMLDVLEAILALDSLACQESALHGFGHWTGGDPERIEGIIDAWLRRIPGDHVLRDYARLAARGDVQ